MNEGSPARLFWAGDRAAQMAEYRQAVITAAKAMRFGLPGSIRQLYDAVDALIELEKQGNG